MNRTPPSGAGSRGVIYFAVAALLAAIAYTGIAGVQAGIDAAAEAEDRAIALARSVGWVRVQEGLRTDPDGRRQTQRYVEAAARAVAGIREIVVLEDDVYRAHSDPERAGARLDRDSLAHKALYDRVRRLQANVRKNVEEREWRPELKRDAYPAVFVKRLDDDTIHAFAAVAEGGRARAGVRITADARVPAPGLPWVPLGAAFIAILGFAGVSRMVPAGTPRRAAGGVLLLASVALGAQSLVDWRTQTRQAHAETRGADYGAMNTAGLSAAAAPDRIATLAETLDLSRVGVAQGHLTALDGDGAVWSEGYYGTFRAADARDITKWAVGLGAFALLIFLLGDVGQLGRGGRALLSNREAYYYLSPSFAGMIVLVFVPVVFGIALGFMQRQYNAFEFAGLANYIAILSDFDVTEPQNFYFKLGVTLLWTVSNVVLHVSIGLFLALMLNDQMLKAKGIYRVILILPWAIPNYITALIWNGMFHKEFGAINAFLQALGGDGISWFGSFWPAFFTNLATNTWLGFPFMMLVSLGALQSIPSDLYEAAWVDGANRWQRFVKITLPLLMPAMVPAIIVGTVWTFNMFNIIYLVSAGQPNGATDILITDAFRWAFERDRYGYAAAYSTVIFLLLLGFTLLTNRLTGATKGAFE